MPTAQAAIDDFLAQKRIAVAGGRRGSSSFLRGSIPFSVPDQAGDQPGRVWQARIVKM